MSAPSVAELRPIDLFEGVDDEHLADDRRARGDCATTARGS